MSLKFRVKSKDELPDYTRYVTEFVLDENLERAENELEMCRFKLKEGARLRTEYKDFYDIQTEFDTVNLADAAWAAQGGNFLAGLGRGKDYLVCGIRTVYQEAECRHEYTLRTKEALWVLPGEHMDLAGSFFDAVITDVKKDKVQVMIPGNEWNGADGKKWFLYSTVYSSPDGTGWYCMLPADCCQG